MAAWRSSAATAAARSATATSSAWWRWRGACVTARASARSSHSMARRMPASRSARAGFAVTHGKPCNPDRNACARSPPARLPRRSVAWRTRKPFTRCCAHRRDRRWSERRLAADLAYYPPVPQARRWTGPARIAARASAGNGPLLGIASTAVPQRGHSGRPVVLVTMGGSDPFGLTLTCAQALAKLDPTFRARFVIGPGVKDGAQVARRIVSLGAGFEDHRRRGRSRHRICRRRHCARRLRRHGL